VAEQDGFELAVPIPENSHTTASCSQDHHRCVVICFRNRTGSSNSLCPSKQLARTYGAGLRLDVLRLVRAARRHEVCRWQLLQGLSWTTSLLMSMPNALAICSWQSCGSRGAGYALALHAPLNLKTQRRGSKRKFRFSSFALPSDRQSLSPFMPFVSVRATLQERQRGLPGDPLIPDAVATLMHAITIAATPERVWPWLVQMGSGRAGWYAFRASPERLSTRRCALG
jgi:hypothetical protein